MGRVRQNISKTKLEAVADRSPRLEVMTRDKARRIVQLAKASFLAQQRADNEWRVSETTPPKYIASFKVEKVRRIRGYAWLARNTDPGATWVEYGAHAGGRTLVLRYYPFTKAVRTLGLTS